HVRFDQVPDDVHVAGPQQLLAHLPARHDPDDHPVEIGLLLDPVPLIPDQRDVIGRYPLDDLERAAAQGLPVVLPLRHGGWVAGAGTSAASCGKYSPFSFAATSPSTVRTATSKEAVWVAR